MTESNKEEIKKEWLNNKHLCSANSTNKEIADFWLTILSKQHQEWVEEVKTWNNERVKKWHKTCLTDTFDNGRFWEAKETQEYLDTLLSKDDNK